MHLCAYICGCVCVCVQPRKTPTFAWNVYENTCNKPGTYCDRELEAALCSQLLEWRSKIHLDTYYKTSCNSHEE